MEKMKVLWAGVPAENRVKRVTDRLHRIQNPDRYRDCEVTVFPPLNVVEYPTLNMQLHEVAAYATAGGYDAVVFPASAYLTDTFFEELSDSIEVLVEHANKLTDGTWATNDKENLSHQHRICTRDFLGWYRVTGVSRRETEKCMFFTPVTEDIAVDPDPIDHTINRVQ